MSAKATRRCQGIVSLSRQPSHHADAHRPETKAQIVETRTGPAVLNARAARHWPDRRVVIVAGLCPNVMPYYLIVDSSINSPADLKGKVSRARQPYARTPLIGRHRLSIRIGCYLKASRACRSGLRRSLRVKSALFRVWSKAFVAIGNTPMRLQALGNMSAGVPQFMVAQDLELVQAKNRASASSFSWITWLPKPPFRWAAP